MKLKGEIQNVNMNFLGCEYNFRARTYHELEDGRKLELDATICKTEQDAKEALADLFADHLG